MNLVTGYIKTHLLTFVLSVSVIAALSVTTLPSQISKAGAAVADSVKTLLQKRSPGARVRGELSDTKGAKLPVRSSQAKSQAQEAQNQIPAPVFGEEKGPMGEPIAFAAPDMSEFFAGPVFSAVPLSSALFFPGTGYAGYATVGGGGGGGTIGGGGGGGGGGTNPPPPGVITAVPETATWLSMVIGFGFTGLLLRRLRSNPNRGDRHAHG